MKGTFLLPAVGGAVLLLAAATVRWFRWRVPEPILRGSRVLSLSLAGLPAAWLASFAILVLRARWILGFWPYPRHFDPSQGEGLEGLVDSPLDPKELPIHTMALWLLAPLVVTSILWMIPARLLHAASGRSDLRAASSIHLASYLALAILVVTDPGGFFLWFAD